MKIISTDAYLSDGSARLGSFITILALKMFTIMLYITACPRLPSRHGVLGVASYLQTEPLRLVSKPREKNIKKIKC
jgi:hypothetical protein